MGVLLISISIRFPSDLSLYVRLPRQMTVWLVKKSFGGRAYKLFYKKYKDCLGKFLDMVLLQSEPYMRLKWLPGLIGNQRYEGYYVDLIDQVAGHVGFDFQLHLVADGKLGTPGDEGSWNGMVGELLRGVRMLKYIIVYYLRWG